MSLPSQDLSGHISLDTRVLCKQAYDFVCEHTKGNVGNSELSKPLTNVYSEKQAKVEYERRIDAYCSKNRSAKVLAAKYWILILTLVLAWLAESLRNEPQYVRIPLIMVFATLFIKLYHQIFASVPLQSIGTRILSEQQRKHIALEQRFDKTLLQVQRAGPLGFFRFLSGDHGLEAALNDGKISCFEHDAMVRLLFAIRNKSYDCVTMSEWLIAELIKRKVPVTVERVTNFGTVSDPHSFIVANHTQGNIQDIVSLNDDCLFICVWHRIFKSVKAIRQDPTFFFRYPLLNPVGKGVSASVKCEQPEKGYMHYLNKIEKLLAAENTSICEQIGLDTVFPSLR